MASYKYLDQRKKELNSASINTNISELLKNNKLKQKKEKRQNIYFAAAAVSVLALSGFIISQ